MAGVGVPQPHGLVGAGAGQPVPVGAKRHTVHPIGVPGQGRADGLTGVGIPQPHRVVFASGGQPVPVGAKRHADQPAGVAGQGRADGLTGVDIPQPHRAVPAGGGQPVPVGAKRHASYPVGVAGDDFEGAGTLDHRPVQRASVRGGVEATGGQDLLERPHVPAGLGAGQHALRLCHQLLRGRRLHHLMSGGHRLLFCSGGPAERDHRNDRTDKGDHGDDRCCGHHGAKNSRTFPERGSMSLGGFLFFARGLQFGLLALLLGL